MGFAGAAAGPAAVCGRGPGRVWAKTSRSVRHASSANRASRAPGECSVRFTSSSGLRREQSSSAARALHPGRAHRDPGARRHDLAARPPRGRARPGGRCTASRRSGPRGASGSPRSRAGTGRSCRRRAVRAISRTPGPAAPSGPRAPAALPATMPAGHPPRTRWARTTQGYIHGRLHADSGELLVSARAAPRARCAPPARVGLGRTTS